MDSMDLFSRYLMICSARLINIPNITLLLLYICNFGVCKSHLYLLTIIYIFLSLLLCIVTHRFESIQ